MTQTERPRTQSAFRGAVYGIDVIDHDSFMAGRPVVVPDDYRGKTRQRGRARELQHRDRQPFSDLIVGDSHVLWEGICTEDDLDAVERRFIQREHPRPRLNIDLNEDNPHMIPKEVQIAQRHARDDRMGRPHWKPFEQRQRESLLEWDLREQVQPMPVRQQSITGRWSPAQIKAGLWSTSWLSTTGLFFAMLEVIVVWQVRLALSAVVSFVLLLWALAGAPVTKAQRAKVRRRRRAARKARRRNKRGRLDLSWITRW